ncbi:MAG TPA: ThiF family adenylyltransferase [Pirellulales bacterium]|jgi:adenylyltransferase/sulfurtransferase|nr:ThiF family adenylyltransferase [Pirellulales bacterium]
MSESLDRYTRQMRYPPIGETGQRRLAAARVLICGCGALGSAAADTLARSGIGRLRIVDRDFVEITNLQRQVLFDEADAAEGLPKAIAAAAKLGRINSAVEVEPLVADVTAGNILALCDGVDLIVDGTDNFETRFLLNEAALRCKIPWIYGGAIGAIGQAMTILPDRPPCLRCVIPESPPPGSMPTCDTAGILASAIHAVSAIQACEAIKILSGNLAAVSRGLTVVDLWENRFRQVGLARLAEQGCATCRDGDFPWLSGRRGSQTAVLCGRNAVQLASPSTDDSSTAASLDDLERKLRTVGQVTRNAFLLRFAIDGYTITLFADGRAIIAGTEDIATARNVYAKYVGM